MVVYSIKSFHEFTMNCRLHAQLQQRECRYSFTVYCTSSALRLFVENSDVDMTACELLPAVNIIVSAKSQLRQMAS